MVKATQRTIARLKAFLVPTGEGRSSLPPDMPPRYRCVCCEERDALIPFSACQACIDWRTAGPEGSAQQLVAIERDLVQSIADWIPGDWWWRVEHDPATGQTLMFYARLDGDERFFA